jgi:hypothetical protein
VSWPEHNINPDEPVGYGFDLPKIVVAPNAPKNPSVKSEAEVAA